MRATIERSVEPRVQSIRLRTRHAPSWRHKSMMTLHGGRESCSLPPRPGWCQQAALTTGATLTVLGTASCAVTAEPVAACPWNCATPGTGCGWGCDCCGGCCGACEGHPAGSETTASRRQGLPSARGRRNANERPCNFQSLRASAKKNYGNHECSWASSLENEGRI